MSRRTTGKGFDYVEGSDTSDDHTARVYTVKYPEPESLKDEAKHAWEHRVHKIKKESKGYGVLDWIGVVIPAVTWLRTYDLKNYLVNDIVAGLSVGAMVVPQGLSYAKLAGLPSIFGLYGAFVPCLVYALLGSSRQLAVGPVAVTSILLAHNLPKVTQQPIPGSLFSSKTDAFVLYNPNSPGPYASQQNLLNHAAVQVAFIAGIIYTGVGLLRLGWLTNFLSHAVISGFMTGAAVTIAGSQVRYIFGMPLPRKDTLVPQLNEIFSNLHLFNWRVFLMGISWLIILETFKYLARRFKKLFWLRALGPLTVTIISIAITNIFSLMNPPTSAPVVGTIPKGLPHFTAGWWFPLVGSHSQTVKTAFIVAGIDIMESISIARALALKNKYLIVANRELRGLGFANLAGSMFHCYTTTGSFSRSAVNDAVGAKTPLACFTTGILVMIVLLVLTPVFKNMPNSAQGAIIISGCINLFDWRTGVFLFKVNKVDFFVWIAAFFVTVFAGVEFGIATSIILALLIVLFKVGFPHTAELGRLPGTHVYRNIKQYEEATTVDGVLVVRFDAPLYFANVMPIREKLFNKYIPRAKLRAKESGSTLRFVVVDLSPVTDVDATAVHFLHDFVRLTQIDGLQVMLANPSRRVVAALMRGGLPELIGEEFIFVRTNDAVAYCQELMAEGGKLKATDDVVVGPKADSDAVV